ncbi:MAG: hypothetical protein JWL59_2879 [Chthoniobacteraceae bacterium]|nr:hypothetical protein [Chthoniobacteraceae bacterium]
MKIPTPIKAVILATVFVVQPFSASAAAGSPSELLEKGIYSEETKGDLEAAIAIYQQLLSEVKAGQSLAAQAQFRIGQCYLKKNRLADATAAFEKLIRDFPNEKELLAKARAYLPGDMVIGAVPWEDGERLQFSIALPGGMDIGAMMYRADAGELGGRKTWRVGARLMAGANSYSQVEADDASFRPLNSRWKHGLLGDVSAIYSPAEATLSRVGKEGVTTIALDKPVFDNEQTTHLMRRLPLAPGYKSTINVFSTLGGGMIPLGLEVIATEKIQVPAGQFECFKVELSVHQTFWIANDPHRTLVQFEGGGVVAKLVSIRRQIAGQPVHFSDDELGISLTAPADWLFQKRSTDPDANQRTLFLLDPEARADGTLVRFIETSSLSATARASAKAWAEEDLSSHALKALKGAVIRPESWKNQTIAGRPGVSCMIDFETGKVPSVGLVYYVPGAKTSNYFAMTCSAEQFETLRPAFEGIVASYRAK